MSKQRITARWYTVWHKDKPEWATSTNSRSAGAARYEVFRSYRDAYPDVKLIDFRSRLMGKPSTSDAFIRCAESRGVSFRCGDRVKIRDGDEGIITGHNASANFEILFTTGKHAGRKLSSHPADIEVIT